MTNGHIEIPSPGYIQQLMSRYIVFKPCKALHGLSASSLVLCKVFRVS